MLYATFTQGGQRVCVQVPDGTTAEQIPGMFPGVGSVTVSPTPDLSVIHAHAYKALRDARAPLLAACDWTQAADVPITSAQKAAWAFYRQALRDITKQPDPTNVTWPTPPQ